MPTVPCRDGQPVCKFRLDKCASCLWVNALRLHLRRQEDEGLLDLHLPEEVRGAVDRELKRLDRINTLIRECTRTPFKGTGKPAPLRGALSGWWSRRIDREHRLVYRVEADDLQIAQCRYHY